MKIKEVHVDGFGIWTGLTLEDLSEHGTAIFGRNEAGKTTLLEFVRTMFYGLDATRRDKYVPPVRGGRAGGHLSLAAGGEVYRLQRSLPRNAEARSSGAKVYAHGQLQARTWLADQLNGVDEATFRNVFCLGLRDLQELSLLDHTEAARHLYDLTTGLDRVSLGSVMRGLEDDQQTLWRAGEPDSEIARLAAERERLRLRVEEGETQGRRWLRSRQRLKELHRELKAAERQAAEAEAESRIVEAALQVQEPWKQVQSIEHELAGLGEQSPLQVDWLEKWHRLQAACVDRGRRCRELKAQGRKLRRKGRKIPIYESFPTQAARVQSLIDSLPWITTLDSHQHRLRQEIARLEAQGTATAPSVETSGTISSQVREALRGPARALRAATRRLEEAKERFAAARAHSPQAAAVASPTSPEDDRELSEALETASEKVTVLRRRVQLEERLAKMSRHRGELQEETAELLEQQVLPPKTLMLLGIPFVLGMMLILGGLFWSTASKLGWPVAILGLAGWALAVVMKVVLERAAARDLQECNEQLSSLQRQIKSIREERDELDAELPRGHGPLDDRLAEAEKELEELERLVPLSAQREVGEHRMAEAETECREAGKQQAEAKQNWRAALSRHGLSPSLSPRDIKEMSIPLAAVDPGVSDRELALRRDELATREAEFQALRMRIAQAASEFQLDLSDESPAVAIHRLQTAVEERRSEREQRHRLVKQYQKILRKYRRGYKSWKRLKAKRRALLRVAGVRHENELEHLAERHAEWSELVKRRGELRAAIVEQVGKNVSWDALSTRLARQTAGELENEWERLASTVARLQHERTTAQQRTAELKHLVKTLADDRTCDEALLELAVVDARLAQALDRWRLLTLCQLALEAVRGTYERERQPQTLRDASRYLERLTEGQYRRVWTPLDRCELVVDALDGTSLPLHKLSSGTREAVFLCLRLALVNLYAARGVKLPLILDDVLVNLDAERCQAAVALLQQFTQEGHQVLLFTCHDHILKSCRAAQLNVRRLPDHAQLAAGIHTANADIEELEGELEEDTPEYEDADDDDDDVTEDSEEHEVASAADPASDEEDWDEEEEDWDEEEDADGENDEEATEAEFEDDETDWVEAEYEEEDEEVVDEEVAEEDPEEEELEEELEGEDAFAAAEEEEDEEVWADFDEEDAEDFAAEDDIEEEVIADEEAGEVEPETTQPVAEAEPVDPRADVAPERPSEPDSDDKTNHRFTWDSPERWWENQDGDAAA